MVILLTVDDDEDLRVLMAMALEARGASLNKRAMLERRAACSSIGVPAVMVCDLGLPGEDGCSAAPLPVRSRHLPALALTGRPEPGDVDNEAHPQAGYLKQIPKPVEMAELVEAIASLVPTSSRTK